MNKHIPTKERLAIWVFFLYFFPTIFNYQYNNSLVLLVYYRQALNIIERHAFSPLFVTSILGGLIPKNQL
jgi:hypothetical protein